MLALIFFIFSIIEYKEYRMGLVKKMSMPILVIVMLTFALIFYYSNPVP
jgi:hypothetical protein